ncbi:MAG: hypothetical protein PHT81_05825 [Endomicrobiaceae bacterium]|jgi:hypothetical protein|nr:hypothetical protein [Endomicrobiaceae bacterium]
MPKKENMGSKIAIYRTKSGQTKLEVNIDEETVWLTQKIMRIFLRKM